MKNFFLILGMILFSNISYSEYNSVGDVTCDQVISGDRNNNKAGKYQVIDWMNGYVTGRNIETRGNKGKNLGDESLYYAVVNYCKKNPLHSTTIAAEYIYERQLD